MYSELANDLQQRVGRSSVAAGACRGRLVAWSSQELLLLFSCQAMYDDLQQTKNSLQSCAKGR